MIVGHPQKWLGESLSLTPVASLYGLLLMNASFLRRQSVNGHAVDYRVRFIMVASSVALIAPEQVASEFEKRKRPRKTVLFLFLKVQTTLVRVTLSLSRHA